MKSRTPRYVLYALFLPAGAYFVAALGARILLGELATIPWFWGVALLLLVLMGVILLYWRPTRVYWRGLKRCLRRIGYQLDRRPRAVTSGLLRGSQLDDDLYLEASEIWLQKQEHYSILWGTYLTSGETLAQGVFVAAVYPSPPWPAEALTGPLRQSGSKDEELLAPVREAIASMPGFSFSIRGSALVGKLENSPIEGGPAAAPKPAAAIRGFEQLADALLMQRDLPT